MRVAIATLGCRLNQYDSASIEEHLRDLGPEFVEFPAWADLYIINTCTVTNKADQEARQLIRRAKRTNPHARVIVTGCYAQVNPDELARMEEVDLVAGLGQMPKILATIAGEDEWQKVLWSDIRKEKKVSLFGALRPRGRTRAYLKIQEGCNFSCAFCIIPQARGRSRSVPLDTVLKEIERMVDQGVREVVLTGIHLGSYGQDLGLRRGLPDLLEQLEHRSPPLRVRLSSLDPREVSPTLTALIGKSRVVCPSLHICAQAGEDGILERMRRNYDSGFYRDLILRVRELLPQASLGTDIIVGFPGESEMGFEESLAFFSSLPLSYFHVFPYSVRRGTLAAEFTDQVPESVKRERALRMRSVGIAKSQEFAKQFLGHTVSVLAESEERRDGSSSRWISGYAENYLPVKVLWSSLGESEPVPSNSFLRGVVTGTDGRWALGKRLDASEERSFC
jgi:threonylcarbamoyladenosine tRNA methylthiotransferase MtaB